MKIGPVEIEYSPSLFMVGVCFDLEGTSVFGKKAVYIAVLVFMLRIKWR
jgi:hypothetical protein